MADDQTDWQQRMQGRTSSPGSPGLGGAIKDAIGAAAKTFGPKAITQRPAKIKQAVEGDGSLGDQFGQPQQ